MYILLVYDVEEKRVARALKTCRAYLHWVQNSVFEGELTEGQLKEFLSKLKKVISINKDSVLLYKMASQSSFEKQIIGQEKATTDSFI